MYLEKLELQGFKSFAHKTIMEFPPVTHGRATPIAAIVGPNGSGKSNIADAVRWVLGEQSVKLLRGKRAEDVIFSGSASLSRLGFAEVSLHLNNEDRSAGVEYDKLIVKRRVYRSGESEYRINGARVRLADIQLLLAQANFGGRSYSVIGQGMTDAILSASPFERKNFFDEATGVKQFQIKREHARAKLHATEENLGQAKSLIRELSPRLKMLAQQLAKREKRITLTRELQKLQLEHFGSIWREIAEKLHILSDKKRNVEKTHLSLTKKLSELHERLRKLEREQKAAHVGGYDKVQSMYYEAVTKKNELAGLSAGLSRELAVLLEVAATHPTAIDTEKLLSASRAQLELLAELEKAETLEVFKSLKPRAKKLHAELKAALNEKQSGNPTAEKIATVRKKLADLKQELERAERGAQEKQNLVDKLRRAESRATTNVFETQRAYQELMRELSRVVAEKNQIDVELAKAETRRQDVEQELEREVPGTLHEAIKNYRTGGAGRDPRSLWEKIAAVRQELEMVGGIPEHAESEYQEAKQRHDFLAEQLEDLQSALAQTKRALAELDATIARQFNQAFTHIEKGFSEYFKTLFGGGAASLALYTQSELETLNEDVVAGLTKREQEHLASALRTGIEIKASPPGKKVASISMLSGGERALTSIALICAIIRANPSPFVVLDEVDAALDEANSERFAQILARLSRTTQFITITHNRATMEQAAILYGVTMGENGVSRLLSVDLEKAVASIA